jgi:hypothetical protein
LKVLHTTNIHHVTGSLVIHLKDAAPGKWLRIKKSKSNPNLGNKKAARKGCFFEIALVGLPKQMIGNTD